MCAKSSNPHAAGTSGRTSDLRSASSTMWDERLSEPLSVMQRRDDRHARASESWRLLAVLGFLIVGKLADQRHRRGGGEVRGGQVVDVHASDAGADVGAPATISAVGGP